MRTKLAVTGVVMALLLGGFLWLAATVSANRAMAQERRAAAQAEQAAARAEALAREAAALAEKSLKDAQTEKLLADSVEANNAAARHLLTQRMEAAFDQQPLAGVLDYLAEHLKLEVHSQRGDIEAAGLSLESPVNLKLKSVRGEMLLELALKQVSPDLSYVVRDGIVIVGTRGTLSDSQEVRVYNCRDLLAAAGKMSPAVPAAPMGPGAFPPGGNPSAPQPGGVGLPPGMAGGSGMGGLISSMMGGGALATPAEQLQRVIRTTIAPESWDFNGGAGTMEEFGGLLVVNQSEAVNDRLEKLLQMLREAAAKE